MTIDIVRFICDEDSKRRPVLTARLQDLVLVAFHVEGVVDEG